MPIHQSSLLALQIKTSTVRLGRLDQRSNSQQATNSLQPHARPNRIGILNGWHNSKDWVQSLMAEASPSIKRKNSWPATKSYKIYIHIDHIFIYFLWLKSKENFPAFVTFVDDKISGSVDSRSKTFDDLRHATRCRRSQVSDLGCYIFIHNIYIYIFIILFIYCYFKEVETMKQPKVQALQSAARSAACCLSSLPKGCSSCTDLHSDIEHSLSKTEQKNT